MLQGSGERRTVKYSTKVFKVLKCFVVFGILVDFVGATKRVPIPEKLLLEYSECHVDLVEGGEIGYFDFLWNSTSYVYVPVTRLVLKEYNKTVLANVGKISALNPKFKSDSNLRKFMLKLKMSRLYRRQTCELILGSHDPVYTENVQLHFEWLLECGFKVKDPVGSERLCYAEYAFYVLLKQVKSAGLFRFKTIIYEITGSLNMPLTIRVLGFDAHHFCDIILIGQVNDTNYSNASLRVFMRDAIGWVFQDPVCGWEVHSDSVLPGGYRKYLDNSTSAEPNSKLFRVMQIIRHVFGTQRAIARHPRFFLEIKAKSKFGRLVSAFMLETELMQSSLKTDIIQQAFITLQTEISFNFVTCYQAQVVSFLSYIRPYQANVWICILVTFSISVGVARKYFEDARTLADAFHVVTRIIFEQGVLRFTDGMVFRCFFALMLLIWLVLTNAYKGIVTTELTTPIGSYQMKTIEEALEKKFQVLLRLRDDFSESEVGGLMEGIPVTQKQLESISTFVLARGNDFFSKFVMQTENRDFTERYASTILRFRQQLIPVKNYKTLNTMVDSIFAQCGKTIFVGHGSELDQFVLRMHRRKPGLSIYFGNDSFIPGSQYWEIYPLDWDKGNIIRRRLRSFEQSTLLQRDLYGPRKDSIRFNQRSVGAMSLASNILSLFPIYGVCIVVCMFIFCAEFFSTEKLRGKILNCVKRTAVKPYKSLGLQKCVGQWGRCVVQKT